MQITCTSFAAPLKGGLLLLVLATLCACSDSQQARAGNDGNIAASSLTFYSKTPADEEPVVTPMEITSITCDTDSETVRTQIELGEEGHVLMHDAGQVWLIEVNLTRFDIPGGKREHVYPEEEETTVSLARNGDIEGYYQFQLHGELEGMYVVEMDISC